MSALEAVATRWRALWFAHAPPEPVAACRILLGCYLCCYLGSMAPHVEVLFSRSGVYVPYLLPDYAPPPAASWVLYSLTLLSSAALAVGYRTTLAASSTLVLFLHHYFLQLAVKHSSFERLIVVYLVVIALSDAGRAWSLDERRASGTRGEPTTVVWTRRILLMQTFALYTGAGLWKALNPRWHDGRLLEATLQGMWASPIGFWLADRSISLQWWRAASVATIAFELVLGVAFLWPRSRVAAVAAGTLFHLANSTILLLPEFLVCLVPYPLFLPTDMVRRAGAALAGWRRVRRRDASAPVHAS